MRMIEDSSLFKDAPLPLDFKHDGGEFYYRRRCRFSRGYPLFVEPPVREMFFASGVYEVNLLPGAHYLRRNAAFLSVEYIEEGSLYVRQDARMYELEAGEVFLMQPFHTAEFTTGRKFHCRKTAITLHGELLPEFLRRSGIGRIDVPTEVNGEKLKTLIARFKALTDCHGIEVERLNGLLSYELLQFLQSPTSERELPPLLCEMLAYLEEHLTEPLLLCDLSERFGCSRTRLIELFRGCLQETPHQVLINLRMRKARELLLSHDELSIKEVTIRIGYRNALNFSSEFKRRFKMSPREYRRMKH